MDHRLFLFDLDDTLLDFRASERLSFARTLSSLGVEAAVDPLYATYQQCNRALWEALEQGRVDKDFLKVERFRRLFAAHAIDADPARAGHVYLEWLPQTVVLVHGARAACEALAARGEIGVITNGIEQVQSRRIAVSGLADLISFVATSEACGHAKPDVRFFAYATAMAGTFEPHRTIIIGDRLEADILGANRFGIDSCWFNPGAVALTGEAVPTCQVEKLSDLPAVLGVA
ncbi:YjjG family noncanonical pyrimidine nucleotidase [Stenotrophomonas sp. CFBP8980]|uniref:YjjG family noncanonical pyrimidine nucleotidase n=1 Tax=Stenotrophomonas sp. CFBP8980 TaxID=3096523 RepID=UPI002A6B5E10|nr:YjjG family noncanonical pyrimidine nucleotidase [Stenotrophomonas sp. CFBP8980]MDY1034111.1 YjjG family noncanonical pyrimidine nucleotidase [Stenotrophomonas sp. CFBP8980]